MDPPPVSDPDKINEAGPSFNCDLYDTQLAHKISLLLLPGLSTASVDNTTGDLFKTPGSVASEIKTEMISYLNHRSETFVADHILLQGNNTEIAEPPHDHPYDVVSTFVDDFAASKRNLFSRVSNWLLSERREDSIDDFAQEMEASGGFWLTDHIESLAQTLLKNVDFKGLSHCERKFKTKRELEEHVLECGYRTMDCLNEGCGEVFCANQKESHDSVCPFKMIPCEQGCSERSIMRREMDRHCITVCSMKLVNCPFRGVGCLADVRQCEVQRHNVDDVGSHLMCVLKGLYKGASVDDLRPRAEQIQQLETRLSGARNARALTNLVKEIDAKLGDLVIKPKKVADLESDKTDNTEKKALEAAEIKEKPVMAVSKEALDGAVVEEVGKKVSDAEIGENVNKEGESKAQKLLEVDEFVKEGEDSSAADLAEGTKTKAPQVVVMDEDKEEEERPETRTNETRGLETEVKDVIGEENHKETKMSAETKSETPSRTVIMDKEENEEGAETINSSARASDEAEALTKSSEAFSKAQAKTEPNFS